MPANSWTCPHCQQKMHSSYDQRDKKTVQCIHCGQESKNSYFQGNGGDKSDKEK